MTKVKFIFAVSVLAIFGIGAAHADISSTGYVGAYVDASLLTKQDKVEVQCSKEDMDSGKCTPYMVVTNEAGQVVTDQLQVTTNGEGQLVTDIAAGPGGKINVSKGDVADATHDVKGVAKLGEIPVMNGESQTGTAMIWIE